MKVTRSLPRAQSRALPWLRNRDNLIGGLDPLAQMIADAIALAQSVEGYLLFVDPFSPFLGHFQDSANTTAVTALAQPIGSILDKAGAITTLQATSGARPTLVQRTSGRYAYRFDGTDDQMASNHFVAASVGETVVTAFQRMALGSGDDIWSHGPVGSASGWKLNYTSANVQRVQMAAGNVTGVTDAGAGQVVATTSANGAQVLRTNGVQSATGALAFTPFAGLINLGAGNGGTFFAQTDIAMFFYCPSVLSVDQMSVFERLGAALL